MRRLRHQADRFRPIDRQDAHGAREVAVVIPLLSGEGCSPAAAAYEKSFERAVVLGLDLVRPVELEVAVLDFLHRGGGAEASVCPAGAFDPRGDVERASHYLLGEV